MSRKAGFRKHPLRPQDYEHRVEAVIQGLGHAAAGQQAALRFLLEQQGPDWRGLDELVARAAAEFRETLRWLRTARRGR